MGWRCGADKRTYAGYTLHDLRSLSSDRHVLALCERVAALEARSADLEGLLAGILECLEYNDPWTKAARQTTAATIRAALEAHDVS